MTNSTHQTSDTKPSTINQPYWMRLTALWLMMTILMTSFSAAWAETASAATQASSLTSSHNVLTPATSVVNLPVLAVLVGAQAIQRPLCDPLPESCIKPADAKKARDDYAKKHGCVYLQDTCKKITVENDNNGAQNNADSSVFGKLWNDIKTSLIDGYEFAKGVVEGLIQQIIDIWDLVTNLPEVVDGLIALGKELYNHPKETLESLWSLLSEGVQDIASQATQCGAYDQGYLIGSYVSPAVALKVVTKLSKASKLAKYTGKIDEVVKEAKLEIGCSSFTAGTLVQTPQGNIAIERVAAGNEVYSRDDQHMRDSVQPVTKTFGRIAPSYRVITTEQEVIYVTDEHPLWVQGKGWTPAKEIKEDDVVAARQGDMLILDNSPIAKSAQVYNFSVYRTHSYFVGEAGLWAHNSFCDIFKPKDVLDTDIGLIKDKNLKGFKGELLVRKAFEDKGYTVIKAVDNKADNAIDGYKGKKGIDAIFKDKDGNYVIVESKTTGGEKPSDLLDRVAGLQKTQNNGRQMSQTWINDHLETMVKKGEMSQAEATKISKGLELGTTKRVYAQTDAKGTTFNEIVDVGSNDAKIGKVYQLK